MKKEAFTKKIKWFMKEKSHLNVKIVMTDLGGKKSFRHEVSEDEFSEKNNLWQDI